MSDFDEEAERERLRRKYEQDRKEREATERMSELLLQGATMTNAHCSACGDPIFRYDGQEFCATCERPVDRGTDTAETDEGSDENGADDTSSVEVTSPEDDRRVVFGGDGEDTDDVEDTRRQARREQARNDTPDRQDDEPDRVDEPLGTPADSVPSTPPAPEHRVTSGDDGASIEAARASLVRTLTTFSRRAEATDDPQSAREYLAAAREAAEALAALRR